jgi:hypothetical protein
MFKGGVSCRLRSRFLSVNWTSWTSDCEEGPPHLVAEKDAQIQCYPQRSTGSCQMARVEK